MTKEVGMDVLLGEWFAQKAWFVEWSNGYRCTGITIKVDPGGVLGVVKAISAEGPMVAFVGAPTIDSLWRKLRDGGVRSGLKWRPDQYRLDKK